MLEDHIRSEFIRLQIEVTTARHLIPALISLGHFDLE